MKGLKISFVLFLFLFVVNIYYHIYVYTSTDDICSLIDSACSSVLENNYEKAAEYIKKTDNKIREYISLWQLGINHGEVDNISTSMEKLNGSLDSDGEHLLIYLGELRFFVDNLYQRERLTVYNIF